MAVKIVSDLRRATGLDQLSIRLEKEIYHLRRSNIKDTEAKEELKSMGLVYPTYQTLFFFAVNDPAFLKMLKGNYIPVSGEFRLGKGDYTINKINGELVSGRGLSELWVTASPGDSGLIVKVREDCYVLSYGRFALGSLNANATPPKIILGVPEPKTADQYTNELYEVRLKGTYRR